MKHVQPRLGILGGGQLARMLALDAHPLGIDVSILTGDARDPAAQVAGQTHVGSLSKSADLRAFFAGLEHLTFESEFIDLGLVREAMKGIPSTQINIFPSLDAIASIQDRLPQKQLLDRFEVPTSPWMEVSTVDDLREAHARFPKGFVLKQRRNGYDGYGTFVMKAGATVDEQILLKSPHGFIAEAFVKFKRELALSFVRKADGEIVILPLVESLQKDSRCFSVHGPVAHRGLAPLIRRFKKLMNTLDYVGILAAELFDTPQGLVVNELAPRVHNSAHYSQDAMTCSQFEYHLRAGLGFELPKVQLLKPAFAMVNLLGEGHEQVHLDRPAETHLHWYGKSENREGRKLGHVNALDRSPAGALKKALSARKEFKL